MKVQDMMAGMLSAAGTKAPAPAKASTGFFDVMSKASSESKTVSEGKNVKKQFALKETSENPQSGNRIKTADAEEVSGQNLVEMDAGDAGKEEIVVFGNLAEGKIRETIEQDLQIGEEELEEAMNVLGLSYLDLLNPENLKQLTMQLKGASDISDILMDDELSTMLTQLLEDITPENMAGKAEVPKDDAVQTMFQNVTRDVPEEALQQAESEMPQKEGEMPQKEGEMPWKLSGQEALRQENLKQEGTAQAEKEPAELSGGTETLPEVSVVKEASDAGQELSGGKQQKHTMENQTELADTMVENIASSVTETVSSEGTVTMTTVEMRQVVVQIVQQIKVVIHPEQTDMQMTLHPEHLGRLLLAVTSKDGVMTANVTVQNEMVKQALEAQMQDLKNAFTEQGLKVEAVQVTVSAFEFSQQEQTGSNQQQEQKKQRRTSLDFDDAIWEEDGSIEEDPALAAISGAGSNVDYTA